MDVGETMLACDGAGPVLDRRADDLLRDAAPAADEVVVMVSTLLAPAIDRLAVRVDEDVKVAGLGHGLQGPVHRRQADGLTALLQELVQVLGGAKAIDLVEYRCDRRPLPGGPLANHGGALICVRGGGTAQRDASIHGLRTDP